MIRSETFLGLIAFASLIALSYSGDAFAEDEGVIEFLEDSYSYDGTAVIRVIDSDMDVSSDVDTVDISISSDADTIGTQKKTSQYQFHPVQTIIDTLNRGFDVNSM